MSTALRFADDADILRLWKAADTLFPRVKAGKKVADWDGAHAQAMDDIGRWLRGSRSTPDQAELGSLGIRTRERLRDCAAYLALHYLCVQNDIQSDDNQLLERKAAYFWDRAEDIWKTESLGLDYDTDRDGDTDQDEQDRPMPARFIRG